MEAKQRRFFIPRKQGEECSVESQCLSNGYVNIPIESILLRMMSRIYKEKRRF